MSEKTMEVQIWGTRGSCATAAEGYLQYGANTCCVSVTTEEMVLIFDAGTGILNLGRELEQKFQEALRRNQDYPKKICLFLSHFHFDHILGLPLFIGMVKDYADITIYGCTDFAGEKPLAEVLDHLIAPPGWPVTLKEISEQLDFLRVSPGDILRFGTKISIQVYPANHPDGGVLYRLESGEKKIGYGLDHEIEDPKSEEVLCTLAKDCDLLIFDGMYNREDYQHARGYGHSCWELAGEAAEKAGVKQIGICHYNWKYTDAFLQEEEKKAKLLDDRILFLREGMTFEL